MIYYEVVYGNDTPKDPTENSNVYDSSNPFVIGKKTTIKAYAVKDGMKSEIVTFAYTVSDKLSVPTPSIDTGAVVASGTVIQLKADKDSTIYYTVDGSDPKNQEIKNVDRYQRDPSAEKREMWFPFGPMHPEPVTVTVR